MTESEEKAIRGMTERMTERMLSYSIECIKHDALGSLLSVANQAVFNAALAAAAVGIKKINASGFLPDGVKVIFGKSGLELAEDKKQEEPTQPEQPEQPEQAEQAEQAEQPEPEPEQPKATLTAEERKAARADGMRKVAAERWQRIRDARAKQAAGEQLTDEELEILRKEEERKKKVAKAISAAVLRKEEARKENANKANIAAALKKERHLEELAKLAEKVHGDDAYDSAIDAELEVREAYGVDRELSDAYEFADAPEVDNE